MKIITSCKETSSPKMTWGAIPAGTVFRYGVLLSGPVYLMLNAGGSKDYTCRMVNLAENVTYNTGSPTDEVVGYKELPHARLVTGEGE